MGVSAINEPDIAKREFRYYSRRILSNPSDFELHRQRVEVAAGFIESEPLQGALADMFYGCWYDMPYRGNLIINNLKYRLRHDALKTFIDHISKVAYIKHVSKFATRWSVLVIPSLDMDRHHLGASSDHARYIANMVCDTLLQARSNNNIKLIEHTEQSFIEHCLACRDRVAFSLVWFRLNKENWTFNSRWSSCGEKLQ